MAQTVANLDAFLKRMYLDGIADVINDRVPVYARMKKSAKTFSGVGGSALTAYFPMKTQLNEGWGSRSSTGATLPTALNFTGQQATVAMKYVYGVLQLEGPALAAGSVSSASFGETMKLAFQDMEDGATLEFARQLHGDGSGFLAQVNGTGNNTTQFSVDTPDTRWMRPGMVIDTYSAKSGGSQLINSVSISDVDEENSTVILATASTSNDNDYFFREDSRGNEMVGLLAMVDDGSGTATYQGITRTTAGNNFNKGRFYNLGGALTQLGVVQAMQKAISGIFSGSGETTIATTDFQSMAWLHKILATSQRYVDTSNFQGGYQTIKFVIGGRPVEFIGDRFSYPGYIYFLNESAIEFLFAKGAQFQWMDRDGRILIRVVGSDAYNAVMFWYGNIACRYPYGNVRLYNYTAPA